MENISLLSSAQPYLSLIYAWFGRNLLQMAVQERHHSRIINTQ
jgi:hypothetical protein